MELPFALGISDWWRDLQVMPVLLTWQGIKVWPRDLGAQTALHPCD